jgi:hypothetical protein
MGLRALVATVWMQERTPTRTHSRTQIHLARQEGRAGEAASLQQQLDEIDSECKQIASAIGRVRKTAAKSD